MKHTKHPIIFQKSRKRILVQVLLVVLLIVGVWNVWKPLPQEINKAWEARNLTSSNIKLLKDTTYLDTQGKRVSDQQIFDEVFSMIQNATSYILVDMFLWNDFGSDPTNVHRALSSELAYALITKKKQNPNIVIQVISDPINSVYGGQSSKLFSDMEEAGILVTFTNLPALRDSNPIISSLWRVFVYPFEYLHHAVTGSTYTVRLFPNILGGEEKVTVRAYLSLLNFKANHRKLIVTDEIKNGRSSFVSLLMSANPHDGSSAHSNVALKVQGDFAYDVLKSEQRIIEMAGKTFIEPPGIITNDTKGDIQAKLITDRAILDEVVATIQATEQGDEIMMLMFYLSERNVIRELQEAAKRGVTVRLILDPNKDAFGKQKNGIPNRGVADTLVTRGSGNISVKWCNTHGEQCHAKVLVTKRKDSYSLILGSANFTRRNIGGYNLESNIALTSRSVYPVWTEASTYFNALWDNSLGEFSTDYSTYQDTSTFKKIIAWIMENSGLGTF